MTVKNDTALPDWADVLEQLKAVGDRVVQLTPHPDDPLERQESWRTLMATLAEGFVVHTVAHPSYPEFVPYLNSAFNIGALVPDFMYFNAELEGSGTYRIRGFRGTNLYTDVMVSPGIWAMGTEGGPLGHWSLDDDARIGSDGSFDVLLSNERPSGHTGDWWRLDPQATRATVRNCAYDWINERDAVLTIERLDVPAARPRSSAAELAGRLADLATWAERGTGSFWGHLAELRSDRAVNQVEQVDWSAKGGLAGQAFLEGLFDLAEDEALILDTDLPSSCRYWSFLVGDHRFATIDWMNRQSSINGHQAVLDTDGRFRAVIAQRDPGVPNWLDTGGHTEGFIQIRWNRASSVPVPVGHVVKLADVRHVLPTDTPVVTSRQREERLRERRYGAQLRRRW